MGKAAILLVIVSTLALSSATISREDTEYNSNITDADYQEQVLSREMAESALNVIVGQIKRDYVVNKKLQPVELSMTDKVYRDRSYDMSATPGEDNVINIYSKGSVGINEYEINAVLAKQYGNAINALTFDGEEESLTLLADSSIYISGVDRKTDGNQNFLGSPGDGIDVHGLSARSETSFENIWDKANVLQIEGVNGLGDVVNDAPSLDLAALAAEATAYTGKNKVTSNTNLTIDKKSPLGTRAAPAITVVDGDFTMKNQAEAVGLVVVNGNVRLEAGSRFEGLILMMGDTRDFWTAGNVEIYGGVAIHNKSDVTEEPTKKGSGKSMGKNLNPSSVSPTTFRLGGGARIQYSSEALMRLGDFVAPLHIDNNFEFNVLRINEGHSRKYGLTAAQKDRTSLDVYNSIESR